MGRGNSLEVKRHRGGGQEQRDTRGRGHGLKEAEEKFFAPRSPQAWARARRQAALMLRTTLSLLPVCAMTPMSARPFAELTRAPAVLPRTRSTPSSPSPSLPRAGRRTRRPRVFDNRLVNPYSYTWCSCDKSHTPPRLLGEDPAKVSQRSSSKMFRDE